MRISDVAYLEAMRSTGTPLNPWTLPEPPPFYASDTKLAMDRAMGPGVSDLYNSLLNGPFSEGLGFLGYPYLAELSQRPEYRRVVEIWAAEATRKWIEFSGDAERIKLVEAELDRFKVRDHFRRVIELDGYFGRGQLFPDLGHRLESPELSKPLIAKAKIKPGALKGFKVVEPFWSYPGEYESTNPLAPDFYKPRSWYVMQGRVHASRMLTIVGREMPDMLKPAYSFGGLSLSQMIKPYVDNWLRTRQSVSDLLHSFSTPVLKTNMGAVLQGGGAESIVRRAQMFNQTRDNRGLMIIDMEAEDFGNVSTPLGSIDHLQAQAQEQIASVSGIPLVILLGVTPSGLNASSDGEVRTFYATIAGYQERVLHEPLRRIIDMVQLNIDGRIDPDLTWTFVDLWETPETEKAAVRKSDADADVAYVGAGIVSAEDVRKRITSDEESPYYGMELEEPELPDDFDPDADGGDPGEEPDDEGEPKPAMDAGDWSEGKHPRRKDGKFGSGGGSGSAPDPTGGEGRGAHAAPSSPTPERKEEPKPVDPKVAEILGAERVAKLQALMADKNSKAQDILDALEPMDHVSAAGEPTLREDQEPDEAFWNSRTYRNDAGERMTAKQAVRYLMTKADNYATEKGGIGVKHDKQARILLGPPAAGKSTSAEQIARTEGYAIVDGDDAKKVIPEFEGGVGASRVHEESGKIGAQVLDKMLDSGANVILPLVGGSPGSIRKRIELLRARGYNVTVDLVDVSPDEAARRMAGRTMRTGRHISSKYFASIGDGPAKTYEALKAEYGDKIGTGRIDGNGAFQQETYLEANNHPGAKKGYRLFGEGK